MAIIRIDLANEHPTDILVKVDEALEQVIDDFEDYLFNITESQVMGSKEDAKKHEKYIENVNKAKAGTPVIRFTFDVIGERDDKLQQKIIKHLKKIGIKSVRMDYGSYEKPKPEIKYVKCSYGHITCDVGHDIINRVN